MLPLTVLRNSILAVDFSELDFILAAPSQEQDQLVEERRVLVKSHDGEQCVEDLVYDFRPILPSAAAGNGFVQQTGHEESEGDEARCDEERPDEQRDVLRFFDPALEEAP